MQKTVAAVQPVQQPQHNNWSASVTEEEEEDMTYQQEHESAAEIEITN